MARKRLERHCGLRGWTNHYTNWKRRIQTFDYCGTVIRFSDCFGYNEREISTEEYNAFTALSIKEQKAWIENKNGGCLNNSSMTEQIMKTGMHD